MMEATSGLWHVPVGYGPILDFDKGAIPRIERKYFKENLIDNTFKKYFIDNKEILLIIPFKMHNIPHPRYWCPV